VVKLIFFYFIYIFSNINLNDITEKTNVVYSESLSAVANYLNDYILNSKKGKISQKTLTESLYKNNIFSYKFLPKTFKLKDNISDDIKLFFMLNQKDYNFYGYSTQNDYLTVILLNQPININYEPQNIKLYQTLKIKGEVLTYNHYSVDLYIKTPSNDVKKFLIPIFSKKISFDYKIKEKGDYIFEFVDSSNNDPKIIAKIPLSVGKSNETTFNCDNSFNITKMIENINILRTSKKLSKLKYSEILSKISYNHSFDMYDLNYFSHISPNKKTPYKRFKENNINFRKILENISKAETLCEAYNEIIDSPGHLNNILDKDIDEMGIGVYFKDDIYYLTQNFIQANTSINIDELKKKIINNLYKIASEISPYFNNDFYLNSIAQKRNQNEYNLLNNIPKNNEFSRNNYKRIKSYFFLLKKYDDSIFENIDLYENYNKFGIDINVFEINKEEFIFLTIILAEK